jgi:magnesium transporter
MNISCIVYDAEKIDEIPYDVKVFSKVSREKCLVLVHIDNVNDIIDMMEKLGVIPVKFTRDDIKRSRLIVDDQLVLVLQQFQVRENRVHGLPLVIVLGENRLIVFSLLQKFLDEIKERVRRNDYRVRALSIDVLFSTIMSQLIDEYYNIIDVMDNYIDRLEDLVIKTPSKINIEKFRSIRSSLIELRRSFYFTREHISLLLGKGVYKLSLESERLLREFYEDSAHLIELIETQKERLADIRDLHLSSISLSLNVVMKKLTAINVIALPLIIIAGIYGMNLEIPEAHLPYAYPLILTIMITFALVLVVFFRKIGWF